MFDHIPKPFAPDEKPIMPAGLLEIVQPVYDRTFRHCFINSPPWLISVDDIHPLGHYDTNYFAAGRMIHVEEHVRFIWPRVAVDGHPTSKRLQPYIHTLVFRLPSGQHVSVPLHLTQDESDRYFFKDHPGEHDLSVLDYPEAQAHLQLREGMLGLDNKPLKFNFHGHDQLMFSFSLDLCGGIDRYGRLHVATCHPNLSWVTEGDDLVRVSEDPWRNNFTFAGFALGLAGGVPPLYSSRPDEDN